MRDPYDPTQNGYRLRNFQDSEILKNHKIKSAKWAEKKKWPLKDTKSVFHMRQNIHFHHLGVIWKEGVIYTQDLRTFKWLHLSLEPKVTLRGQKPLPVVLKNKKKVREMAILHLFHMRSLQISEYSLKSNGHSNLGVQIAWCQFQAFSLGSGRLPQARSRSACLPPKLAGIGCLLSTFCFSFLSLCLTPCWWLGPACTQPSIWSLSWCDSRPSCSAGCSEPSTLCISQLLFQSVLTRTDARGVAALIGPLPFQ